MNNWASAKMKLVERRNRGIDERRAARVSPRKASLLTSHRNVGCLGEDVESEGFFVLSFNSWVSSFRVLLWYGCISSGRDRLQHAEEKAHVETVEVWNEVLQ